VFTSPVRHFTLFCFFSSFPFLPFPGRRFFCQLQRSSSPDRVLENTRNNPVSAPDLTMLCSLVFPLRGIAPDPFTFFSPYPPTSINFHDLLFDPIRLSSTFRPPLSASRRSVSLEEHFPFFFAVCLKGRGWSDFAECESFSEPFRSFVTFCCKSFFFSRYSPLFTSRLFDGVFGWWPD